MQCKSGYGLDGPGSNPGGGEIFCARPDRSWGPPSLLYNRYRVFPGGKVRPRRDADPSPILVPWSRKSRAIPLLTLWAVQPVQSLSACTVELYLYSSYGPYGLYRASVPLQGCTLPFYYFMLPGEQGKVHRAPFLQLMSEVSVGIVDKWRHKYGRLKLKLSIHLCITAALPRVLKSP